MIEGSIHKKETLIIESQHFPCINYIKALFVSTHAKIDLWETYRKMSFRNRCVVAGSNGLIHLSVPLEKGRSQKQPVKDVRISYSTEWQLQHWRTIESCYNRSPFFEFYRDWLEVFYAKKPVFLADLNMEILQWVSRQLGLTINIETADEPYTILPEEMTDLRGYFMPKNFQSINPGHRPFEYVQVFADRIGFQPNLSILDLLFCAGPQAASLLRSNDFSF